MQYQQIQNQINEFGHKKTSSIPTQEQTTEPGKKRQQSGNQKL